MGAVLRVATMRRLWYAQIVCVFGDFLALFAVITVITFKLHATAQQVTGLQIAYLLPIALLGVISRRLRRPLAGQAHAGLQRLHSAPACPAAALVHNVYGFYAVLASISIISSFFGPAQGVAIRSAVPFHGLRSANALMQQVMFIMRIIGPSVAASWSRPSARAVATCWTPPVSSPPARSSPRSRSSFRASRQVSRAELIAEEKSGVARILADMKEGASFIFHHTALLFVIVALAAGMFVMGCFGPLIAVYVRDNLHASTKTFGITIAMIGVGLLIGVNTLNTLAKRMKNTLQVYLGLGGIALGTALLAVRCRPWPPASSAAFSSASALPASSCPRRR